MKKIGVVEGYYGKSSNFDERKKIIESLNRHDLNFYLYAPKEDPFLRSHIDIEYTKEWLTAFRDFVDFSKDHSVNVGVGLAPVKTADTADLKEKIKVFEMMEPIFFLIIKFSNRYELKLSRYLNFYNYNFQSYFFSINLSIPLG